LSKGWFASPREEALELAYQTRKTILTGNTDPVAILRACLVIATDLSKVSIAEWIAQELSGFKTKEVPDYRIHSCPVFGGVYGTTEMGFEEIKLWQPVHYLASYSKKHEDFVVSLKDDKKLYVSPNRIDSTLAAIVDKCFQFLNATITELQYGGVVEFLMEEIRRKTDEKLATFDPKIAEETQSLYLNLMSTNPADWSKVGHSCRKILKFLADHVFPHSETKYTAKDKKGLRSDRSLRYK
jgi:hypothetical protein